MLTLAQRRHWLATSPSEFQRRANVSLLLDNDGHPRKSIYLKVFFFSMCCKFHRFQCANSHTNRITRWTDVIFGQRWADGQNDVGPT